MAVYQLELGTGTSPNLKLLIYHLYLPATWAPFLLDQIINLSIEIKPVSLLGSTVKQSRICENSTWERLESNTGKRRSAD